MIVTLSSPTPGRVEVEGCDSTRPGRVEVEVTVAVEFDQDGAVGGRRPRIRPGRRGRGRGRRPRVRPGRRGRVGVSPSPSLPHAPLVGSSGHGRRPRSRSAVGSRATGEGESQPRPRPRHWPRSRFQSDTGPVPITATVAARSRSRSARLRTEDSIAFRTSRQSLRRVTIARTGRRKAGTTVVGQRATAPETIRLRQFALRL